MIADDGGDIFETYPRYSGLRWFPEPDWAREHPERVPQQDWLENRLPASFEAQDIQATLTELTAATIAAALASLPGAAANCFVCGGGAHNGYLLERLRDRLAGCGLQTTDALGTNPDYVEAAAFAWLARERINRRAGNIPAITNASRETLLGAVYAAE